MFGQMSNNSVPGSVGDCVDVGDDHEDSRHSHRSSAQIKSFIVLIEHVLQNTWNTKIGGLDRGNNLPPLAPLL